MHLHQILFTLLLSILSSSSFSYRVPITSILRPYSASSLPPVPACLHACLLGSQVRKFKPSLVALQNASLLPDLKEALADLPKEDRPEIVGGEDGIVEVTTRAATTTATCICPFVSIALFCCLRTCSRVLHSTVDTVVQRATPSPVTSSHPICQHHTSAPLAYPPLLPACLPACVPMCLPACLCACLPARSPVIPKQCPW